MTKSASARTAHLPLGGPLAWRSLDLITLALLGVAFGVAFWGWDMLLYPGVSAFLNALFPPASSLTLGVWLLPAVVGGLLVRRPGAALMCELVAASVEALLGNQWGFNVMVSAVLQGLGVEIVLALFLWRRFKVMVAVLAATLAAVFELVLWEWWVYMPDYSLGMKVFALAMAVISGAGIAGLGGWSLVRAMAATGGLSAFPPGRERLAR